MDTLRRSLTTSLLQTSRQWRRAAGHVLGDHCISEACATPLIWIGRLGGGVRQVVLATHVGIESASLVRLLDQLEASGLVIRKGDPSDRRANCVWLTEEGQKRAETMEELLANLRSRILADVGKADLEAALRVLKAFEGVDELISLDARREEAAS